jgi:hypothetical protein
MFVIVKLTGNHPIGSIVAYSSSDSAWALSSSISTPLGVIESVEQDEETLEYWGRVRFSGSTLALADRAIPDEGGEMTVLNGKVYVDNTADHCGIIAPLPRGQASRVADDLVMVHIR